MSFWLWLFAAFAVATAVTLDDIEPGFDDQTLANVRANLLEIATESWELGTAAEALTEFSWPALSVFNISAFPPPIQLNDTYNASDVLGIAQQVVAVKPFDSLSLIANDGAAGDPASIGVAVLLTNWTRTDRSNTSFSTAAGDELSYLFNDVPRSDTGAISHRTDEVQLWADFVYMVPPFIAYFGALQGGDTELALLQVAYDQCRLYRDELRDDGGLWRHIALGSWQDDTHWGTGNAWAAAGMLRVLQTLNHSSQADQFTVQQTNLTSWIQEIITAAWSYQHNNGTLFNIIDDPTSFGDTASTTLLASVTYRMAAFTNDSTLLTNANKALNLTKSSVDTNGWLLNTVDPLTFNTPSVQGSYSPEGQAFVLLLHSAWRDYVQFISNSSSGSTAT